MKVTNRTIFIVSGDLALAQRCSEELAAFGGRYRTLIVDEGGAGAKGHWPHFPRGHIPGRIRDRSRREAKPWNPLSHC